MRGVFLAETRGLTIGFYAPKMHVKRGRSSGLGAGLRFEIDLRPSLGARQRFLGLRPIGLALRAARADLSQRERYQNSSRSANWIWRSRFAVSRMTPAEPAISLPEKTINSGYLKFA